MSNQDLTKNNKGFNQGDLISRNALLKAMEEERQYLLARGQTGAEHILVHHCLPIIDNASTVDAIVNTLEVRSQGKWLDIYATHIAYECSNCHVQMPITDYFNFCPNCGAKMQMGGTK